MNSLTIVELLLSLWFTTGGIRVCNVKCDIQHIDENTKSGIQLRVAGREVKSGLSIGKRTKAGHDGGK